LHGWLRSGNAGASQEAAQFLSEALGLLGDQRWIRCVRADSGFYADHFLSFLEERALPYIVVARLTNYLKSRLYQVTQWQAIDKIYCVTKFNFKLWNWKTERRFVVVREEVQTNKAAVGRKLLDLPGYAFRVFVTNRCDPALEIWRDYNGRATVECRIDELKNELAADHFCLRSFFATESAFLAVLFGFNLLGEFQRALDPALKTYKQPASLRFEVSPAAQSSDEAGIIWFCTCPKIGVVTPVENPSSTAFYIGLRQLLRSSIPQYKMPHEIHRSCNSISEYRFNAR
jgi:hypothetical protein